MGCALWNEVGKQKGLFRKLRRLQKQGSCLGHQQCCCCLRIRSQYPWKPAESKGLWVMWNDRELPLWGFTTLTNSKISRAKNDGKSQWLPNIEKRLWGAGIATAVLFKKMSFVWTGNNRAVYYERGTYGSRSGRHKPITAMWQGGASLLHRIIFYGKFCRLPQVQFQKAQLLRHAQYKWQSMPGKWAACGYSMEGSKEKSYAKYQAEKSGVSLESKLKIAVNVLISQISSLEELLYSLYVQNNILYYEFRLLHPTLGCYQNKCATDHTRNVLIGRVHLLYPILQGRVTSLISPSSV